jgi:ADP-heptose:LPS heptosyltransferase
LAPSDARSFLIIQTAFTGDVILATALIEKLHEQFPDAAIDFLLRKGNEDLLQGHPFLRNVLVWDKKHGKIRNLFSIIRKVRSLRFDVVVNAHRFTSSGLITIFSGAKLSTGFDKNPLSFLFTHKVQHLLASGVHEIDRNQKLIEFFAGRDPSLPKLYPNEKDFATILPYKKSTEPSGNYCCLAPASVWFTKQFPREKWVEFLDLPEIGSRVVFLIGAPSDRDVCEFIRLATTHPKVVNLAGKLSYLESAALMKGASMNYVNDSAPMHLASSVNAPVTAIFCSTIPAFGFGPLSNRKFIVETQEELDCRPCGLHGYNACPLGHFKCALTIEVAALSH